MALVHTSYDRVQRVYFLGIGGIGMSAIARYFLQRGVQVAGYDRTATPLTGALEAEGVAIHYQDSPALIPGDFRNPSPETLVVYTAAIPETLEEKVYLLSLGHRLYKRAEVLGIISEEFSTIAVAGTHGKTTTTTLLAHILHQTQGCKAFLGGISNNYSTNLILDEGDSQLFVAEADEYDRSFLQLHPQVTAITSLSADHLDIYGTVDALVDAFRQFASQNTQRKLIVHESVQHNFQGLGLELTTYGQSPSSHYWAENIHYEKGRCHFTLHRPRGGIVPVVMAQGGTHNVMNTLAALACVEQVGMPAEEARASIESFKGVLRRFDIRYRVGNHVYIDDYAHHPEEIRAAIATARTLYPGSKITGVFQPHLYTRTRDFLGEFASALSELDSLLLLPIYPAREEPIKGVSSESILDLLPQHLPARIVEKAQLVDVIAANPFEVILAMGAGDIGAMVEPIVACLKKKEEE